MNIKTPFWLVSEKNVYCVFLSAVVLKLNLCEKGYDGYGAELNDVETRSFQFSFFF